MRILRRVGAPAAVQLVTAGTALENVRSGVAVEEVLALETNIVSSPLDPSMWSPFASSSCKSAR